MSDRNSWLARNPRISTHSMPDGQATQAGQPARPQQDLSSLVPRRVPAKPPPTLSSIKESSEEDEAVPPKAEGVDDVLSTSKILFSQEAIAEAAMAQQASTIADLILEQCLNDKPCSVRALNILHRAAGGIDLFPEIPHPEIQQFSKIPSAFGADERLPRLKALALQFKARRYLSSKVAFRVNEAIQLIEKAGIANIDRAIRLGRLRNFRTILTDIIREILTSHPGYKPPPEFLARRIGDLITNYPTTSQNGSIRALKIMYCAAGGKIEVDLTQPETDVEAKELRSLPDDKRFEHIQALNTILNNRLTGRQQQRITQYLEGKSASSFLKTEFEKELIKLDAVVPPTIEQ